jgi:hypothetical protein
MFQKTFNVGEAFGTIRRINPRGKEMDRMILTSALSKVYPELAEAVVTEDRGGLLGLQRLGSVAEFTELAVQIGELHGIDLEWVSARAASPAQAQAMYEHFLYDESGLWDEIQRLADELNNPNGTQAGLLTEAQQNDPLSASSEKTL